MIYMESVSIIILNYNGSEITIECLESIFEIEYPNYEIILVDNNSNDNSLNEILLFLKSKNVDIKFFEYDGEKNIFINPFQLENDYSSNNNDGLNITVIKNDENYGYAQGNNIGIKYCRERIESQFFLILNNDTVVKKDFLKFLINEATENKEFGILSPLIYDYYTKKIQYSGDKIGWYSGRITKSPSHEIGILTSDTISGASMLITSNTLELIGYLPVDYFMLWEDIDYSTKAWRNDIKCGYVTKSKIWHKGSVSIGKISLLRVRCSMRNRIIFWRKYSNNWQFSCFLISLFLFHLPVIISVGLIKSDERNKFVFNSFKGIYEGFTYPYKNHFEK